MSHRGFTFRNRTKELVDCWTIITHCRADSAMSHESKPLHSRYRVLFHVSLSLMVLLWSFNCRDSILWLYQTFSHPSHGLNSILFSSVLLFFLIQSLAKKCSYTNRTVESVRSGTENDVYIQSPDSSKNVSKERRKYGNNSLSSWNISLLPSLVCILSMIFYNVSQRYLMISHIEAALFFSGMYGLSGFVVSYYNWKRNSFVLILLVLSLPFSTHLNSFIGFPLRLFEVQIVGNIYSAFTSCQFTDNTILLIENELTHIDLPCSGVKGLWAGLFFLIVLTWIEKKRLSPALILFSALFGTSLLLGNIVRISGLVFFHSIIEKPELASQLHVPLGLVLFAIPCTGVLLLFKHTNFIPDCKINTYSEFDTQRLPVKLLMICALVLVMCSFLPTPLKVSDSEFHLTIPALPPECNAEKMSLSAKEKIFFHSLDNTIAQKYHFDFHSLQGSLLLISSPYRRAHHNPMDCLQGNGHRLNRIETLKLGKDFYVRYVTLNDDETTATYWFQSPTLSTPELAGRIWYDLTGREKKWLLVSIVFERFVETDEIHYKEFVYLLKNSITTYFQEKNR